MRSLLVTLTTLTTLITMLLAAPGAAQDAPPDELADETLASPLSDPDDLDAPPPPLDMSPSERTPSEDREEGAPADPSDEGLAPAPADPESAADEVDENVPDTARDDDGYGYGYDDLRKGKKRRRSRADEDAPDALPPAAGVSPLLAGLASAGGAALGIVLPVVVLGALGATGAAVSFLLQNTAPQFASLGGLFILPLYGAPFLMLLGMATGGTLAALPFITWWKGIIAGGAAALVAVLVYFVGSLVGILVGGFVGGVLGFAYLATLPPGSFTGLEFLIPFALIASGIVLGSVAGPLLAGPAGVLTAGTVTYIAASDEAAAAAEDGYE
jgi:hypothetical protein